MKRNKFIAGLMVAAIVPFQTFAKTVKKMVNGKGFKISAGEGRIHGHIKLKGVNANIMDLKISGSDSDNGMAIFEQTSMSPEKELPIMCTIFKMKYFL